MLQRLQERRTRHLAKATLFRRMARGTECRVVCTQSREMASRSERAVSRHWHGVLVLTSRLDAGEGRFDVGLGREPVRIFGRVAKGHGPEGFWGTLKAVWRKLPFKNQQTYYMVYQMYSRLSDLDVFKIWWPAVVKSDSFSVRSVPRAVNSLSESSKSSLRKSKRELFSVGSPRLYVLF